MNGEGADKFKNLRVMFIDDGKFEEEIDRRIGIASGVLRELAPTFVTKAELNLKTKRSLFECSLYTVVNSGLRSRKDEWMG
ncbi:unnamed protein product [Soboliphyme baturini]|uniref:DNA-directed RNA polymerase n=1 Tax=Soboliphyme baturini TaxID=241478 RepID=A0A183IB50_9BILA|nr:unnamed protein product [Soboliphyme baturini]